MRTLYSLYHLMRADFLERIRRYSFLVVLLATAVFGYSLVPPIDAPYNAFAIGIYRPFYSSAWVGTVFGVVVATMVSLLGFYLVRNAIARDYETRVGHIIATTPISKPLYMLGKWLSNLAVLSSILVVLTVVALIMQLIRAEDTRIDLWALVVPIWCMGLPMLALAAAVAVVFESLPVLRSGIGSAIYFFLWVWMLIMSTAKTFDSINKVTPHNDIIGISRTMVDLRDHMISLGYDPSEGVIDLYQPTQGRETKRFVWNGIDWTFEILVERLIWVALAAVITLGAVIPFDRFDPARRRVYVRKRRRRFRKRPKEAEEEEDSTKDASGGADIATHLYRSSLGGDLPHHRFWSTLKAEFLLLVRGHPWWWYGAVLGLAITCLVTPYKYFDRFFVPLVWLWPIFLWSAMGNQEYRHQTDKLVFSCAHLMRRQLPAAWLAGVLVAAIVGGSVAARFLVAGEMYALFGWITGIVFVPSLALALGVWTNSGRLFEMVYFMIWLLGVYAPGRFWPLDFLGRGDRSAATGVPVYYLVLAAVLLALAVAGRRKRITATFR